MIAFDYIILFEYNSFECFRIPHYLLRLLWDILNRSPTSTNLPPTSTHIPITFTRLHPPPPTFQSFLLASTHLHSPFNHPRSSLSTTTPFGNKVLSIFFLSSLSHFIFFLEASFTKITKRLQNRIALDCFTHLCIFVSHRIFKQQFVK